MAHELHSHGPGAIRDVCSPTVIVAASLRPPLARAVRQCAVPQWAREIRGSLKVKVEGSTCGWTSPAQANAPGRLSLLAQWIVQAASAHAVALALGPKLGPT